jgi:uncharacterized protein (DUF302 family)
MARYSMQVKVRGSYDEVKQGVVEALKEQGFGILSEISVSNALKEKIGVDIERYEILGACNPQLAHQALEADRSIGLLLPCNVVLRELGDEIEVSILDPEAMFEVAGEQAKAQLAGLPQNAKRRLQQVIDKLGRS